MYIPKAFHNKDNNAALDFIAKHNFADIVTAVDNEILSNKIPLLLSRSENILYGHFGRGNPQLKHLENSSEVLMIFSGPHAYVSPQWYVSKNMVPTWNFQTVQVRGKPAIVDENKLIEILENLSRYHESVFPAPWTLDRLEPAAFQTMIKMIVGFRIEIADIQFKEKMSQNRGIEDQQQVITSLLEQADLQSKAVAAIMKNINGL